MAGTSQNPSVGAAGYWGQDKPGVPPSPLGQRIINAAYAVAQGKSNQEGSRAAGKSASYSTLSKWLGESVVRGREAARAGSLGQSGGPGKMRSPNSNSMTSIPDVADINITNKVSRLQDSTTYFKVVPSNGSPEDVISTNEVQCAIDYRNCFKSGSVLKDYTTFFQSLPGKYFAGFGAALNSFSDFSNLGGIFSNPNVSNSFLYGAFSNDSIYYWVKKYFAIPELSKFVNATGAIARQTWSSSTYSAIHMKFVMAKYQTNLSSFYYTFSDSIGLLANSKYHQLDSTQPIFDITQQIYGVPIPFTANMENKVGPTARNLMYDLSKYTTAQMRRNLMNIAYYNGRFTSNFKVSSRVPHGCNLVNDIAFFVEWAQSMPERVAIVQSSFAAFNTKLFQFVQYISNIGNRCALNLRDVYAPDPSDKDFVVSTGSTDIAANKIDEQKINLQLGEINNFARADAALISNFYEQTASFENYFKSYPRVSLQAGGGGGGRVQSESVDVDYSESPDGGSQGAENVGDGGLPTLPGEEPLPPLLPESVDVEQPADMTGITDPKQGGPVRMPDGRLFDPATGKEIQQPIRGSSAGGGSKIYISMGSNDYGTSLDSKKSASDAVKALVAKGWSPRDINFILPNPQAIPKDKNGVPRKTVQSLETISRNVRDGAIAAGVPARNIILPSSFTKTGGRDGGIHINDYGQFGKGIYLGDSNAQAVPSSLAIINQGVIGANSRTIVESIRGTAPSKAYTPPVRIPSALEFGNQAAGNASAASTRALLTGPGTAVTAFTQAGRGTGTQAYAPSPNNNGRYFVGNIGPTSRGPHLHIDYGWRTSGNLDRSRTGKEFRTNDIAPYLRVGGKPLSTASITSDYRGQGETGRGTRDYHTAIDYGFAEGTSVEFVNGAKVIDVRRGTSIGDQIFFTVPGKAEPFRIIHGTYDGPIQGGGKVVSQFGPGSTAEPVYQDEAPQSDIPTVSRQEEIENNIPTATSRIVPTSDEQPSRPGAPARRSANTDRTGLSNAAKQEALNFANNASSRPYSNRQRMIPFAFEIQVEDVDGEIRLVQVDFLLKKIVQDNYSAYKTINTLVATEGTTESDVSSNSSPSPRGNTVRDAMSQIQGLISGFNFRDVASFGNVDALIKASGINVNTPAYGAFSGVLQNLLTQKSLTSKMLSDGLGAFAGQAINRLPTAFLGAITNSTSLYNSIAGQLNSIGAGTLLPSTGSLLNSINPFNYIDINISGLIPSVSLGSLGDLVGIFSNIASSGPPRSIGEAIDLIKSVKNIICNFQIPFIDWPIIDTLIKLRFNPERIGQAIAEEFNKILDRLGELFNPTQILQRIRQSIEDYFKNLIKELFVCDAKSTTSLNKSGQAVQPSDLPK